jgi:hypothetical protein
LIFPFGLLLTMHAGAEEKIVAELGVVFPAARVLLCRTEHDARRYVEFEQSHVDVARGLRKEPLPFPTGIGCGYDEYPLQVIAYADESLNGEIVSIEGKIVRMRFVEVVAFDALGGVRVYANVSRRFVIKGFDPPEKESGRD